MSTKVAVAIGDQVYVEHGEEEFGSVPSVSPQDLVVDVENFGDVVIPATAVLATCPRRASRRRASSAALPTAREMKKTVVQSIAPRAVNQSHEQDGQ